MGVRSRRVVELGELCSGGGDKFLVGVGVAGESPAAVRGLCEEHPSALGEGGVASSGGDDGELLVAVEGVGVGEHLDPHVAAVVPENSSTKRSGSG